MLIIFEFADDLFTNNEQIETLVKQSGVWAMSNRWVYQPGMLPSEEPPKKNGTKRTTPKKET